MKARLLFLVFLVALLATNIVFGETFNVTNPEEFQSALTIAESNGEDDVINVAAGIYNITSTLTYSTNNGDSGHTLTIQGAGADKTVLDGGGSVQILYIDTDADHNGGDAGGDVTIKGMTFENGNGDYGGGVYVHGSSITIKESTFSENSAYWGGGVDADSWSGTVTITNNTFSGNSANCCGGGVCAFSDSGTVTITNNTFSGNSGGGGVCAYSWSGTVTITNNTFSGNSANDCGGGVDADSWSGTVTITNNTFSGNSANYGGGVYTWLIYDSAILNVYNNILFDNIAYVGDDLYVNSDGDENNIGSIVNLYNNDFSGNADFGTGQSEDLYITVLNNLTYHHADNIQDDPLFLDPIAGDYHLTAASPCIDAGTADAPELPAADFEGDPRIVGSAPDIGADEYYTGQLDLFLT